MFIILVEDHVLAPTVVSETSSFYASSEFVDRAVEAFLLGKPRCLLYTLEGDLQEASLHLEASLQDGEITVCRLLEEEEESVLPFTPPAAGDAEARREAEALLRAFLQGMI